MASVLTTFSGKFGDILWSLPTVRAVYQMIGGERVDLGIMPAYRSLLPLLEIQPYIAKAFVIENWECTGSPWGDQPWQPPKDVEQSYECCFHLGYKMHPGIHRQPTIALIDFIADQQGIALRDPIPFIEAQDTAAFKNAFRIPLVAYAFNPEAEELKSHFIGLLQTKYTELSWWNVSQIAWKDAACFMKSALCFIGDRSANNVVAHGVGQKNIFIFEPNTSRHADGVFGKTFGCPYGEEKTAPIDSRPDAAAEIAAQCIRVWQEQYQLQEATQ